MLRKIFSGSSAVPMRAVHVRRIAPAPAAAAPAANDVPSRAEPTGDEPAVHLAHVDQPLPEIAPIRSLEEIGPWRTAVPGLTAESDMERCIVLDREYSSVLILATPEFYASGAHSFLLSKVRAKKLSIESERVAAQDVIAGAWDLNDKKQRGTANLVIKDDERNAALYEDLVRGGFALGATDVHFEFNYGGRSRVLVRLFGRIRPWKSFDTEILLDAVGAGFFGKTKSGTASGPSWSKERSLNTITEHVIGSVQVHGRFTSYPVTGGLDVVVRLLKNDLTSNAVATLSELGYAATQVDGQLQLALRKNSGMLVIAGSTGSGKSTTLKTLMNELPNKEQLKRYSVEDPVEYLIPGVRQISIQRGADEDDDAVKRKFLSALRSLVRLDPDVVMIGEIRDMQSAQIAGEMVQTGHRVLTTVHGDNVIDTLSRMTGGLLALPSDLLATRNFLSTVMYQKLLPVLCDCKIPAEDVLQPHVLQVLRSKFSLNTAEMRCASARGCDACRVDGIPSEGTKGLTVAAEILVPTPEIREAIKARNWTQVEALWRGARRADFSSPDMTGKTAFEHALYKASIGLVDPRDIEREFEAFESYTIYERKN